MAHKLGSKDTLDSLEEEVMFTIAMLQADEDAMDLLPHTDAWLGWIDSVRGSDRTYRQLRASTDANRVSANLRLDMAVADFGDDLLTDCDKNRKSSRWLGFFPKSPTVFNRQPLADEVLAVQGWLDAASSDPVVNAHRDALTQRTNTASSSLRATNSLRTLRGQNLQTREQLATQLTDARDILLGLLVQRSKERKLPREWPDAFFRVEEKKSKGATEDSEGTPAAEK